MSFFNVVDKGEFPVHHNTDTQGTAVPSAQGAQGAVATVANGALAGEANFGTKLLLNVAKVLRFVTRDEVDGYESDDDKEEKTATGTPVTPAALPAASTAVTVVVAAAATLPAAVPQEKPLSFQEALAAVPPSTASQMTLDDEMAEDERLRKEGTTTVRVDTSDAVKTLEAVVIDTTQTPKKESKQLSTALKVGLVILAVIFLMPVVGVGVGITVLANKTALVAIHPLIPKALGVGGSAALTAMWAYGARALFCPKASN